MKARLNIYYRFLIILLLFIAYSPNATALIKEIEIKGPSLKYPSFTIKEENGVKTWSMVHATASGPIRLVLFSNLDIAQAQKLLKLTENALLSYESVKSAGRCPTGVVRSGKLGQIQDLLGSQMDFEVVCRKNNIQLEINSYDEYLINIVNSRIEAAKFKTAIQKLITALENQQASPTDSGDILKKLGISSP